MLRGLCPKAFGKVFKQASKNYVDGDVLDPEFWGAEYLTLQEVRVPLLHMPCRLAARATRVPEAVAAGHLFGWKSQSCVLCFGGLTTHNIRPPSDPDDSQEAYARGLRKL